MAEQPSLSNYNKRKERKEYFERKEKVQEQEKGNFDRIIFIRGTGGFWVVIGHSAVILANKIGKDLKMRVPLRNDSDYDFKSKEGKISIRNLEFYKKKLLESGLVTEKRGTSDIYELQLVKPISPTEFEVLAQAKELKKKQLEEEVLKSVPMPKTHANITEVVRAALKIYSKYTNKDAKEIFGSKVMNELRSAQKVLLMTCLEDLPFAFGLQKIKTYLSHAQAGVMQMMELGIWNVEDAAAIATGIIETRTSLEREEKQAIEDMNKRAEDSSDE
ncbi:hypothetical protein IKE71_02220 [Candidatus Saccharibacteria bacterium]|nr:hypothetical protein [Candidatus Saccharibacteria bacterium]